jgi:hypothetical protein
MYTLNRKIDEVLKTSLCSVVWVAMLCLVLSVAAQDLSPPEENLEYLWQTLDRNYAIFGPKHVDGNALHKVYRSRVMSATSDDGLFEEGLKEDEHGIFGCGWLTPEIGNVHFNDCRGEN